MGEPTRRARLTAKADDEENLPIDRDSGMTFKFMEFGSDVQRMDLLSWCLSGYHSKKQKKIW